MTITVLDASNYQAGLDWRQARAQGVGAGIAKLTEGTAGEQSWFSTHWAAIGNQQLGRGAYGFSRWDLGTDPVDEAHWFLAHLPALQEGDVLALDIEDSPIRGVLPRGDLSSWALAWLQTVAQQTRRDPLVYSDYAFARAYLADRRLGNYGLWVAAYGPQCPAPFGPWSQIALWQFSNKGSVGGIPVDESVFYGNVDQFRAYGRTQASGARPAQSGTGRKWLVLVDMQFRAAPHLDAVYQPVQLVYKGACLDATGRESNGWIACIAGGRPGWLLKSNCRPV